MLKKRLLSLLTVAALIFGLLPSRPVHAAGAVLYVKLGGLAAGPCNSWAAACTLPVAITTAASGDEIWVQAGTHLPGASAARSATFQLKDGVSIYGGFAGTETVRFDRNWAANLTILSGDLDSSGTHNNNDAYHVVTGSGVTTTAILDGFTITGGYANGSNPANNGAGLYNSAGSPTLVNLIIASNTAGGNGGGVYNTASSPSFASVTISYNTAGGNGGGMDNEASSSIPLTDVTFTSNISTGAAGGGMFNDTFSTLTLTGVTFTGNKAATFGGGMFNRTGNYTLTNGTFTGNSAAYGGALVNNSNTPVLTNTTFTSNSASSKGGAIYNYEWGSPVIITATIANNTVTGNGGGIFNEVYSDPSLNNVTFTSNSATGNGGGMFNSNGVPTITNCSFSGNNANGNGGGMDNESGSHAVLTDVTFNNNTSVNAAGGAIFTDTNSHPIITNATFTSNSAHTLGGAMYSRTSNYTLKNASFINNSAIYGGGMANNNSQPRLSEITFSGNSASYGGAMHNEEIASLTLVTGIFSGNSASSWGGAIYNTNSSPTLVNTDFQSNTASGFGGAVENLNNSSPQFINATFARNSAGRFGGAIDNFFNSSPSLTNSILWGNTAVAGGAQIYNHASTPTLTFSDIQDAFDDSGVWNTSLGVDGDHNLDADPIFGPASTVPPAGSPVLDVADPAALPGDTLDLDDDGDTAEILPFDRDGNTRIWGSGLDMGAVEFHIWYVDDNGTPGSGCTSWADACPDLQTALAFGPGETWVAAGIYKPGSTNTASYQLRNGQALFGGFAGTETLRIQRDWLANPATLSGDLDSSGTFTDTDAYHVVVTSNTESSVRLDGFTITGGYAPQSAGSPQNTGGGILNLSGSPVLANLQIENNMAYWGGGMNNSGNPLLQHVTFKGNLSRVNASVSTFSNAGGMYNTGSPMMVNVTFIGNQASRGGAIYITGTGSSPTIINSAFFGNTASLYGGGCFIVGTGRMTFINSIISGNTAGSSGGALQSTSGKEVNLVNVTISSNTASVSSGGIYGGSNTKTSLSNVILWGNSASVAPQIYINTTSGTSTITFSDIQDAYNESGEWNTTLGVNGGGNIDADPLFADFNGADDLLGTADDDLRLTAASPAIDAGVNASLPADLTDLDGDGDTTESIPLDLDGQSRFIDHVAANTGSGTVPIVDMGAYEAADTPPVISSLSDQVTAEDTPTAAIPFTIGDLETASDALTLSAISSDPALVAASGVSFGGSGASRTLAITPEADQYGQATLTISVFDGISTATTALLLTVTPVNDAPVIASIFAQLASESTAFSLSIPASDADPTDTLSFVLAPGAPAGAAIDPASGLLTWTPSEDQGPGLYPLSVSVTDGSATASASFTVSVAEVNQAPVLNPIATQSVEMGDSLSFTVSASDPDLPSNTLTFTLEPGAPAGAAIDPASGLFTWTPAQDQAAGIYSLTVRVTDDGSPALHDTRSFQVLVIRVGVFIFMPLVIRQ